MKISYFFLFLWVIFPLLDPDPDPQPRLGNCSFLFLPVFVFSRVGTVPILCTVDVPLQKRALWASIPHHASSAKGSIHRLPSRESYPAPVQCLYLVAGRCSGSVDISYGSGTGNKNSGSGRPVYLITGTDPSRILPGHLRRL
jgi:hypothetical protein